MIAHLDRQGTRQVDLAKRAKITRQAVQQLIDELERDGIVRRRPDPDDRRAKIIVFAAKGNAVLHKANEVKRAIERAYVADLGVVAAAALRQTLRRLRRGRDRAERKTHARQGGGRPSRRRVAAIVSRTRSAKGGGS